MPPLWNDGCMSPHAGRSVAVVTALTAVLLSTGCGDDSAASRELSLDPPVG